MKSRYDVVVVGAGPAGSVAARCAAAGGLDVLLIEKRQEIGSPVRCAEAVGVESLRPYLALDSRWVNAEVARFAVCNAVGDVVCLPPTEPTLVVERKIFDRELARLAAEAGAEVQAKTTAVGLLHDNGRVSGVRIQRAGQEYEVSARLVVAADGPESQTARWAGLETVPPLNDYYVSVQYLLSGVGEKVKPTECQYHLDVDFAPGGYAWVFPKGSNTANVGLVIEANYADTESAQARLERFVERHFPHASVLSVVVGGIPVTGGIRQMATHGLVVVGDAAHHADPLTGGGIGLGMMGAGLAMEVAVDALRRGDVSAGALRSYEAQWRRRFGRSHQALYKARKLAARIGQESINDLIKQASQLDLENMSLGEVALRLFAKHPLLLVEVGKLIATGFILK
ncbi:MAG: NAD(P)/FAD-dependent oxidoreductase [Anaerolineae bacterium]|nr:NAD(P)/FAD-dependent oxidoreductase [Anaerolineae bacterium]